MIIEIKDLPTDRKVKHITFDITFEEDGTHVVKTIPHVPVPSPVYGPIVPQVDPMQPPWTVTCDTTANVPLTNLTAPTTPEGTNARAPKDIPPEMTNMEF
jgi:hypothetical protein